MLWGIQRGKIVIIGARPAIGKSAFSSQLALDIAKQGFRVMFLSLEMSKQEIFERMFCNVMKVNNRDLQRGRTSEYAEAIEGFKQTIQDLPLVISDCIGKDWQQITALLDSLEKKPDVIFIDHLSAIRTPGGHSKTVIDDYLEGIAEIAKHQKITFIMACQINRDNQKDDDKTPQLHELKGTGKLEEIADIVIMLHWPWKYDQKKIEIKHRFTLIVGKHRNGETGIWEICYKPENYHYSDFARDQVADRKTIKEDDIDWEVMK